MYEIKQVNYGISKVLTSECNGLYHVWINSAVSSSFPGDLYLSSFSQAIAQPQKNSVYIQLLQPSLFVPSMCILWMIELTLVIHVWKAGLLLF
jgi:hypothetical protein